MLNAALLSVILSAASTPVKTEEAQPQYLYKILSVENWTESLSAPAVKLSKDDEKFIHFSKQDQLERIVSKYWAAAEKYVVLKIDPEKLKGKLVFETNPGGSAKYYHLYDGSIPLDAIVESQVIMK
jgi:uncharacterized protein (DUF952 family)